MPKEQVKEKEEEKTVDIDSSGPDTEVEIKDDQEKELEKEATAEPEKPVEEKQETSDEKQETQETKVEEKDDKKQELEQYSEGVQKRIAKLTKKWREAERQKEAAIDFAKGVQAEHSELRNKYSKLEPNYVKALEHRVTAGMEAAKAKLAAAREAGDINAEVEAQKNIAQLGVEETRLTALKERQSLDKEQEVKTPSLKDTVNKQMPAPDPRAEAWAEKNAWFGKDSAMTYTAFDYHKKLTEQEGFDPNSDEYYAEIDKRMRIDFPHKFGKTESQEPTKLTQTVASATRSVKPGRKSVRLTSSQVAIAKKLGVPLEEYAKQLKITKEV